MSAVSSIIGVSAKTVRIRRVKGKGVRIKTLRKTRVMSEALVKIEFLITGTSQL